MAPAKTLNQRAEDLLRALVKNYISEGLPVGSKKLAQAARLDLSPASIRNVMADLEKSGLITSPHTSSGRIPTIQGYRYFVDSLLTVQPIDHRALDSMLSNLLQSNELNDTQGLVSSASEFLSSLTSYAGIVTIPRLESVQLLQIEFIPLSDKRVLTILVTNDKEVQNRVIPVHREFSREELQCAANYLNQQFAGKKMTQVREEIMKEMNKARKDMDQMMRSAVEIADAAFNDSEAHKGEGFVVAGQTNLMTHDDLASVETLRQVFDAFNEKRDILRLLDQCLDAEGIQIFIGDESGYLGLGECSMVTSTYSVEGEVIGSLGVIGPTRMPYDQVISVVDITAKVLGAALNSK